MTFLHHAQVFLVQGHLTGKVTSVKYRKNRTRNLADHRI